jgi:hypothetical protein
MHDLRCPVGSTRHPSGIGPGSRCALGAGPGNHSGGGRFNEAQSAKNRPFRGVSRDPDLDRGRNDDPYRDPDH